MDYDSIERLLDLADKLPSKQKAAIYMKVAGMLGQSGGATGTMDVGGMEDISMGKINPIAAMNYEDTLRQKAWLAEKMKGQEIPMGMETYTGTEESPYPQEYLPSGGWQGQTTDENITTNALYYTKDERGQPLVTNLPQNIRNENDIMRMIVSKYRNVPPPNRKTLLQMMAEEGRIDPKDYITSLREEEQLEPKPAFHTWESDKKKYSGFVRPGAKPEIIGEAPIKEAATETVNSPEELEKLYWADINKIEEEYTKSKMGALPSPKVTEALTKARNEAIDLVVNNYEKRFKKFGWSFKDTEQGEEQQKGGKQLDEATARQILREAGGDRNKAREIAKQRGYIF